MTHAAKTIALMVIASLLVWHTTHPSPSPAPPGPEPGTRQPFPGPWKKPWLPHRDEAVQTVTLGGPEHSDGTQVTCDLPVAERTKNTGGKDGAGLCVFTSIGHAARWQNEKRLTRLQQDMRQERGGGYPQKVDAMIAKYGPGAQYLQYEGNDPTLLKAALATGRMPCVTYNGHDPHYGKNQAIAHMVNLVHLDDRWAVILDNNFINDADLVWLSPAEFLQRWKGKGNGWAVILLASPPPPVPHN
jgi:hypothetical protein